MALAALPLDMVGLIVAHLDCATVLAVRRVSRFLADYCMANNVLSHKVACHTNLDPDFIQPVVDQLAVFGVTHRITRNYTRGYALKVVQQQLVYHTREEVYPLPYQRAVAQVVCEIPESEQEILGHSVATYILTPTGEVYANYIIFADGSALRTVKVHDIGPIQTDIIQIEPGQNYVLMLDRSGQVWWADYNYRNERGSRRLFPGVHYIVKIATCERCTLALTATGRVYAVNLPMAYGEDSSDSDDDTPATENGINYDIYTTFELCLPDGQPCRDLYGDARTDDDRYMHVLLVDDQRRVYKATPRHCTVHCEYVATVRPYIKLLVSTRDQFLVVYDQTVEVLTATQPLVTTTEPLLDVWLAWAYSWRKSASHGYYLTIGSTTLTEFQF